MLGLSPSGSEWIILDTKDNCPGSHIYGGNRDTTIEDRNSSLNYQFQATLRKCVRLGVGWGRGCWRHIFSVSLNLFPLSAHVCSDGDLLEKM